MKSFGSSGPIVDPAEGFDVAETLGCGARTPIARLVGVVEERGDGEGGPVQSRRRIAHPTSVLVADAFSQPAEASR